MRTHSRLISHICTWLVLLILVVSLPAMNSCSDSSDGLSGLPPEAKQAAEIMLSSVTVSPPPALVLFTGPVEPGTVIRENTTEGPVELQVPDTPGTYYAFFINDNPYYKYKHPVRYAYVNLETGEVNSVSASYRMTIYRPNQQPTPFSFVGYNEIKGVDFLFMEGDGAPGSVDINHKPEAEVYPTETYEVNSVDASYQGVTYRPYQQPVTFELVGYQEAETGGCCCSQGDDPAESPVDRNRDSGSEVPPTGESQGSRSCGKHAIVLDGGDEYTPWWSNPLDRQWWYNTEVDDMAEQADTVAAWLSDPKNGFKVWRTSQYWGNDLPRIDKASTFWAQIDWYINHFWSLKAPFDCCDELFIYIGSHGGNEYFHIYAADGSGYPRHDIHYRQLFDKLNQLPPWVKLTMFIDTCESGGVIDHLEDMNTTDEPEELRGRNLLREFYENHCALTILTSVATKYQGSPSGVEFYDSPTEDFMEGASMDLDGDGYVGDIQDRFRRMYRENPELEPQAFHRPLLTQWCSLDGGGPEDALPLPPPQDEYQPVILAEPSELQIEYQIGEACPNGKNIGTVSISNVGTGTLLWELAGSLPNTPLAAQYPWLDIQPARGVAPSIVWLKLINCEMFTEPGTYTADIFIDGWDSKTSPPIPALNSGQAHIRVTVIVYGRDVPTINAYPASFSETYLQGEECPEGKYLGDLSITNDGGGALHWSIKSDVPWLGLSAWEGDAPKNDIGVYLVNCEGIPAGVATGHITISGYDPNTTSPATNSPVIVTVTVNCLSPTEPSDEPLPAEQTLHVSFQLTGQCSRSEAGCSCTANYTVDAEDVSQGDKYPVTNTKLEVNDGSGWVEWHNSGDISLSSYHYPGQKTGVACGKTFSVRATAANSIGQTVTATGTFTTQGP